MADLETMRRNPGSVSKRDLDAALRENGWVLERQGAKHEIWSKGDAYSQRVPRSLKGTGTIRRLIETIIASNREG